MEINRTYGINWFAVVIFITMILIFIFLILIGMYFFNLIELRPPNRSESIFLFWLTVIIGVIVLVITIISLIKIFTHQEPFYEEKAFEDYNEPISYNTRGTKESKIELKEPKESETKTLKKKEVKSL